MYSGHDLEEADAAVSVVGEAGRLLVGPRERALEVTKARVGCDDEAPARKRPEPCPGVDDALSLHCVLQLLGYADAGGAGAVDDDALVCEVTAARAQT